MSGVDAVRVSVPFHLASCQSPGPWLHTPLQICSYVFCSCRQIRRFGFQGPPSQATPESESLSEFLQGTSSDANSMGFIPKVSIFAEIFQAGSDILVTCSLKAFPFKSLWSCWARWLEHAAVGLPLGHPGCPGRSLPARDGQQAGLPATARLLLRSLHPIRLAWVAIVCGGGRGGYVQRLFRFVASGCCIFSPRVASAHSV